MVAAASAKDMTGLGPAGQGVPNYDIYGHHHSRAPFKDMTHLLNDDIRHPRWLQPPPQVKSRGELQQARKRGRIPDGSYDFDGDGVVGQLDYFVGRSFDKNCDGSLTPGERRQAKDALKNGFLDKFIRGVDSQGAAKGYTLKQTKGVILSADNPGDVSALTYGKHHNAHHAPPHATKTALELSRLADAKGIGTALGEKFIAENAHVREPQPPHHQTHPRTCEISHIRERAEADHQVTRVRGGLLPVNQPVNPEREFKTVGLGHEADPFIKTRGQLLETRKEAMKRNCEDLRAKGDEFCVCSTVRRAEKEAKEYEFRRASCEGEPKTLSTLKDARRLERIEYDMANFGNPRVTPQEFPRFSDRPDVPFWMSTPRASPPDSGTSSFRRCSSAPTLSVPVFKVTEQYFGRETMDGHADLPEAAHQVAAGLRARHEASEKLGSNTVKRYTAACIDRGDGRNVPRLFDNIQPVLVGPMDLQPLDVTSSMETIRRQAMKDRAEDNKRNKECPRRSQLWYESQSNMPSQSTASGGATGSSGEGGPPRQSVPAVQRPALRGKPDQMMRAASSEPALRLGGEREPRFFGHTLAANPKAASGVRSGGFQRLDMPAVPARPARQAAPKFEGGRRDSKHTVSIQDSFQL